MKDETQTKYVTNRIIFSLHVFDIDHFRSYIPRRTTSNKQVLLSIRELSKTKISNHTLKTAFSSEYNILWLKVTMHNLLAMHLS
jgi:hypothetical protein